MVNLEDAHEGGDGAPAADELPPRGRVRPCPSRKMVKEIKVVKVVK